MAAKTSKKEGTILAPQDYLVPSIRLATRPLEIKVTLDVPENAYAILGLVPEIAAKSKLRLANILHQGKETTIVLDNIGVDAYRLYKGQPLVTYRIITE